MNRRKSIDNTQHNQNDIDDALANVCGIVACVTLIWLLVEVLCK